MRINLHIERLVLDGLCENHAAGSMIGAALEAELARLLAAGGLAAGFQSGGSSPSLPVGAVLLTASKPGLLGQQIAQTVYQGIGPEPSSTWRGNHART
jgi:hypothetical protein